VLQQLLASCDTALLYDWIAHVMQMHCFGVHGAYDALTCFIWMVRLHTKAFLRIIIVSLHCQTGLASSSTGRNSRAEGPQFRRFWQGLRSADRNFGPEAGGVSTKSPAKRHLPSNRGPWWAAGRNWPRPFQQLVEICRGSLRALLSKH
jgi:hypothetical protein